MGLHNSRPVTRKDFYNTISSGICYPFVKVCPENKIPNTFKRPPFILSGPILLDNLECSGEESSLLECGHNSLGDSDCGHGEDVGLMCESIHSDGTR